MTTMMSNRSTRKRAWRLTDLPESVLEDDAQQMPKWLADIRRGAFERFQLSGLPTGRDEEWRLTNLKPIRETEFALPADVAGAVSSTDIERLSMPAMDAVRLVFVNGHFAADLSTPESLPKGVSVQTFREALAGDDALLRQHLTKYASDEFDPFVTLNTALIDDGVVVHVAKDVTVDTPIYLLCVTSAGDGPVITHPRNLLVAEQGSRATIIEDYVGTAGEVYLTNAVTELVVGPNAHVHHYMLERESESAYNVSTLAAHQSHDSNLSSHAVLLGGALVRNNVNPILDGEGCDSLLNGLYVGRDSQHLDSHMRVMHNQPNCESRQFYKGIMDDSSHGVFTGRIIVARGAQKTDAVQSNQNLLLSESARANSKPQLEIYADDVKCTHGSTTGALDEDAVFYLQSRGLDEHEARGMLVRAFAGESLARMNIRPVRDRLEELLALRLPFEKAATARV